MLHVFFKGHIEDDFGNIKSLEAMKDLFECALNKIAIAVEKREFTPFGVKLHLERDGKSLGWVWEKFVDYFSPFHF